MPGNKKHRKKKSTTQPEEVDEYKPPKSFIFRRGKVGATVKQLVEDMRHVMSPNTALHLHEQHKNSLKDFVHVSSQLGITQFFVFSATELGTYLRLLRTPQGPTLTFKVNSYSLMADIHKLQARPKSLEQTHLQHAPILVLNNFSGEEPHVKLMASAFQNAFPALNIQLMNLKDAKRVVLINFDKTDETLEFRHYLINTAKLGVTKSIKRVLQRRINGIGQVSDIAEYVLGGVGATESDAEDMANTDSRFEVEEFASKTKKKKYYKQEAAADDMSTVSSSSLAPNVVQSAVRLTEIGPRMQLKLIKIQDGFSDGAVLYHALKTKTQEEIEALERMKAKAKALKAKRRAEQERRVAAKKGETDKGSDADVESDNDEYNYEHAPEETIEKPDDVEWYRKEVGEEPTEEEIRELRASQPVQGSKSGYNPHWGKKGKKRSGAEISGNTGDSTAPPKKKIKTGPSSSKPSKKK